MKFHVLQAKERKTRVDLRVGWLPSAGGACAEGSAGLAPLA